MCQVVKVKVSQEGVCVKTETCWSKEEVSGGFHKGERSVRSEEKVK